MTQIVSLCKRQHMQSDLHQRKLFITWRLHGSLARKIYIPQTERLRGNIFVAYDHLLDTGVTGPHWLKDPRVAESVVFALQAAHEQCLLTLHAYVLMTNHIHMLLEPHASIAKIAEHIKDATARQSNLILGRPGARFWEDESFDHWVHESYAAQLIRAYIERNPVDAGLVKYPQDWPWSSASNPIE